MASTEHKAPGAESTHTLRLKTSSGMATLELARKGRRYDVRSFEVDGHPGRVLAFKASGPGVENLDETSDARQCFGVSTRIRIDGVLLDSSEMRASSLEELEAALRKAKVQPFDPEEI